MSHREQGVSIRIPEHNEQAAVIDWCRFNEGKSPELHWIFSIPNGAGFHHVKKGAVPHEVIKLKQEGMRNGVPDLCLPVPKGKYHGLFIEMKARDGSPSADQIEFLDFLEGQGYVAALAYGFDQAVGLIERYLNLQPGEKI